MNNNMKEVYRAIAEMRDNIIEEIEERGEGYSREEYDFDDGYVSALDWVLEIMSKK